MRKALPLLLVLFCVGAALAAWRAQGRLEGNQRAAAETDGRGSAAGVYAGAGGSPTATPAPVKIGLAVGNRAPDFTLPTLGGARVQLSSLRGKPVLVNFWATWCPPCKQEMPDIQQYWADHHGQVEIAAVNLTDQERSISAVQQFMADRQFTFPVYLDQNGETAVRFAVQAVPTSYFIDKDGIIRAAYKGAMRAENLATGFQAAGLQ